MCMLLQSVKNLKWLYHSFSHNRGLVWPISHGDQLVRCELNLCLLQCLCVDKTPHAIYTTVRYAKLCLVALKLTRVVRWVILLKCVCSLCSCLLDELCSKSSVQWNQKMNHSKTRRDESFQTFQNSQSFNGLKIFRWDLAHVWRKTKNAWNWICQHYGNNNLLKLPETLWTVLCS